MGLWTDWQSCFPQCEVDWLRCTTAVGFSKMSTKLRHTERETDSMQERSTCLSYIFQQNKSKHLSSHTGLSLQSSKHSLRWWKLLPLIDLFRESSTISVKSQGLVRREVFFSALFLWTSMALFCFPLVWFSKQCVAGREGEWLTYTSPDIFSWLMTRHEYAVMAGVCFYLQNFISILVLYLPVSSNIHWIQGNDIAVAIDILGRGRLLAK